MKEQTFIHQNRIWTRRELPDCKPVTVTEKPSEFAECPVQRSIWNGPHILTDGQHEWLCERSIVHDAGRLGVSLTFTEHTEPPTPEERKRNRANLDAVIRQLYPGMCLANPA